MSSNRSSRLASAILGAVCAAIIGLFFWMVDSSATELSGPSASSNHYNLLVQGFQQGHLTVNREAPEELAQLPDPYDPVRNARCRLGGGLHDMSYYKGRMYLYFGVTPALVLFWPWAVLTSHYLFQRYAVTIFCVVGFLAAVLILRALRRRYSPEAGVGALVAGVLIVGFANGVPLMLQRAEFWEVAVSCGMALILIMLAALWKALHSPSRRAWWLAAASLALGLAVGSRPFLLICAPALLIPLLADWREARAAGAPRRIPWSLLLAVALPLAACGIGLMLYNQLRFDSPFEFGQRYQLAGDRQDTAHHFSLGYLWFNFCVYFLEPVRWGGRFPFVNPISTPALPAGHAPVEDPFGVLTNIPVLWLALAVPLLWRGRPPAAAAPLRWFVAAVVVCFGVCAFILLLFYGTCSRYESEFLITLTLLAAMGVLGIERAMAGRTPGVRWTARAVCGALLAFSVAFNLLAAVDRYAVQRCRLGNLLDTVDKDHEGAMRQYELALRVKPDYAEGHSSRGNVLRELNRVPEAIAECEAALRIDPNYAPAHNNLGNALLASGRRREAIAHYLTSIKVKPSEGRTHYNYGIALAQEGRTDEAIASYREALRINPDDGDASYNLGNALLQKGRLEEAIAQFKEALQLRPSSCEVENNLGNALLQVGRTGEAISHFQAALKNDPGYAEAHNNLGAAFFQAGRIEDAAVQFQAAARLKPGYDDARRNLQKMLDLIAAKTAPAQ